jgi:hypothetical protein
LIVDGASHQSSTGMAETFMGPEDLAGGSCRRGNAFVALGRSQSVQSSRLWLACRRRGIVGCVDSDRDRIASEVSDLVRRAPFAFGRASRCNR